MLSASPTLPPAARTARIEPAHKRPASWLGPMHDAGGPRALAESEKDRAENVMIVDLLRNDLSGIRPGTVAPELFALEHPTGSPRLHRRR